MKKIIFVCHGSICRSPAAEFIAKDYLRKSKTLENYDISSLAVSFEEIGNDIYPPMKRELLSRGIKLERHSARRITQQDYDSCDYIFYMDKSNEYYLNRILNNYQNKIFPIFHFSKGIYEIEDPWYSDRYSLVVDQISECIEDIFANI